jgi:hypothetical protein
MDIGDPDDIPTRRKRLPSMQELGAFDLDAGGAAPALELPSGPGRQGMPGALDTRPAPLSDLGGPRPSNPTVPPAAAPSVLPSGMAAPAVDPAGANKSGATTRPALTPEQLRQALAKADPQTRLKLLNLIVGGRPIQHRGGGLAVSPGPRARPAPVGTRTDAPARPASAPRTTSTTAPPSPRTGPAPLLKIDDNTELLDASTPIPSAQQRKLAMQAQVDATLQQERQRAEASAHKVIFPAYDPNRHGEDVRSTVRRRPELPVEGHFPAPRQPLRTAYTHPDGKPMTPEENKVEEVLQAQRCEETLTVLARDGVNGLLLSPRDLDAAVAQGVLDAATAATLWKTWSALRPVIHVIADEPPEVPAAAASADADGPTEATAEPDTAAPQHAAAAAPEPVPIEAAGVPAPARPVTAVPLPSPSTSPSTSPSPSPLPMPSPVPVTAPGHAPAAEAVAAPQASTGPTPRRWNPGWALRALVAVAVLNTAWQFGQWLWYTGWGWTLLAWLQGART